MAVFRPYPLMTLATAVAAALLVWLGLWQLERMDEKTELAAQYETRRGLAPAALSDAYCADPAGAAHAPVLLTQTPGGETVRLYGRSGGGEIGWRLFETIPRPDCDCDGEACPETEASLLVETGFETPDGRRLDPPARLRLDPAPRPGLFAARNSPQTNAFHHFDAAEMAERAGTGAIDADVWIVGDDGPPASLAQTPPERHFGYALTWFGLALTLLGVWITFHIARRRFTLR